MTATTISENKESKATTGVLQMTMDVHTTPPSKSQSIIKKFEKVCSQKVLSEEEQRKKARFNARFAKFENMNKQSIDQSSPLNVTQEQKIAEFRNSKVSQKSSFFETLTESRKNSVSGIFVDDEIALADEQAKIDAENERLRKESFARAKSEFQQIEQGIRTTRMVSHNPSTSSLNNSSRCSSSVTSDGPESIATTESDEGDNVSDVE